MKPIQFTLKLLLLWVLLGFPNNLGHGRTPHILDYKQILVLSHQQYGSI